VRVVLEGEGKDWEWLGWWLGGIWEEVGGSLSCAAGVLWALVA